MIEFFSKIEGYQIPNQSVLSGVIETIAADYGKDIEYVNVIVMTDDDLLDINKEFLKHDYYTDIITFNYAEEEDLLEAELYISLDRVRDNAGTNEVEAEHELDRVILHGVLHLAGFEDNTSELKNEMRAMEDHYLNTIPFHVKPDLSANKP